MSRGGSVGIAVASCIELSNPCCKTLRFSRGESSRNIVPNENVGNSNNEFLVDAQVAVLSGSEC